VSVIKEDAFEGWDQDFWRKKKKYQVRSVALVSRRGRTRFARDKSPPTKKWFSAGGGSWVLIRKKRARRLQQKRTIFLRERDANPFMKGGGNAWSPRRTQKATSFIKQTDREQER